MNPGLRSVNIQSLVDVEELIYGIIGNGLPVGKSLVDELYDIRRHLVLTYDVSTRTLKPWTEE